MNFSDLLVLTEEYTNALWSPDRMGVHFGCDCGCGGNNYTAEEWDAEVAAADVAIIRAKKISAALGLFYDGVE